MNLYIVILLQFCIFLNYYYLLNISPNYLSFIINIFNSFIIFLFILASNLISFTFLYNNYIQIEYSKENKVVILITNNY